MNTKIGMTIKEIAEIASVDERTIRRWIEQTGKMPDQNGILPVCLNKMSAAQGKDPARFTITEVLSILKSGGRHTLAALLAENAKLAQNLPALPSPQTDTHKQKGEITHNKNHLAEAVALYKSIVKEQKHMLQYQKAFIRKQDDIIGQLNSMGKITQRKVKNMEKKLIQHEHSAKQRKKLPMHIEQENIKKTLADAEYLITEDIATILNITQRSVRRRATKEKWKYFYYPVKGREQKRYYFASLPTDIQQAWQNTPSPLS